MPSERETELETELQRLIAQRRGCVEASRRAVLDSMTSAKLHSGDSSSNIAAATTNEGDDEDDFDAGIVEDDDEGVHDLEKYEGAAGHGNLGIERGGGGAGRSRGIEKEQAVGTRAGKSDVDASLRNLLLASQEENAYSDIDSLRARRMRNSSGMLSLPVPREPAFSERGLMAELGAVSLKEFADVDANLVKRTTRGHMSREKLYHADTASPMPDASRPLRRTLSMMTPDTHITPPTAGDTCPKTTGDAEDADERCIGIEERNALRDVAVEWYRYVLGIVRNTNEAVDGSQSTTSGWEGSNSRDILDWLHACRTQIQYIEARLEALTTDASVSGGASAGVVDPRSIVNASDMLFMARAMTYRHQVSLPVHRLLTRITTMLPTVFSTSIFSDATDVIARAYSNGGSSSSSSETVGAAGGPTSPVNEFAATHLRASTPENGVGRGASIGGGTSAADFRSQNVQVPLQTHALSSILESEESLYCELNSLTLKLTSRRIDYETPSFSVKLLFEQRFIRHATLAKLARGEGFMKSERPSVLADDDDEGGPMEAADVNSERYVFTAFYSQLSPPSMMHTTT